MRFEIIICTYNRPGLVLNLINQLNGCFPKPDQIIIVDSSDIENQLMKDCEGIKYIQTKHKNQPYQRYVGYLSSSAEIVIFLDDDLELVDNEVFLKVLNCYSERNVEGVSGGIDYESIISASVNNTVDKTTTKFRILNFISGVPRLKPGKIYPTGLTGGTLKKDGQVDYFNGPFMSFKRSALHSMYDPTLFSIFEEKLGMGEDKVISMKVGLKGKLWFLSETFFRHPPVASHYYTDLRSFFRRVGFSRLYLSRIFAQYSNRNLFFISLHYYYFMIWRLLIAFLKHLTRRTPESLAVFQGYFEGLVLAIKTPRFINSSLDWEIEARRDANK